MSYILDALKRAESERSRGAVPNIHAQPDAANNAGAPRSAPGGLLAALIGLLVLALAAGAGWWLSRPAPALPNPAALADGPPARQPAPALGLPSALPPAASAAPVPLAPAFRWPIVPPPVQASAAAALPAVRIPKLDQALAGPAASAPVVARPEARIYAIKELPEHIRNSLPALQVSGATYSESPANRMLIVNGNIFHEGDKLTAEVSLQEIKLRAAVLSFRGYRYSISY